MSGGRPEEMIENTGRIKFWRMTGQLGGGGTEMTVTTGAFRRPAIVRCIQFYPIAIKLPDVRK